MPSSMSNPFAVLATSVADVSATESSDVSRVQEVADEVDVDVSDVLSSPGADIHCLLRSIYSGSNLYSRKRPASQGSPSPFRNLLRRRATAASSPCRMSGDWSLWEAGRVSIA